MHHASSYILVDRFHFKSHLCSEIFDPDSYRSHDGHKTTSAEAINSRMERIVPFLRYVCGELLVLHLTIRFSLLNIVTQFRRQYGKDELKDEDLWSFFGQCMKCECVCCENQGVAAIQYRDHERYGINEPNYSTHEDIPVVNAGAEN